MCHPIGESQVIASNVWASQISVQTRPEGNFEVSVIDVEPCLTVAVARNGLALGGPVLGPCPAGDAVRCGDRDEWDGDLYGARRTMGQ